MSILKKTLITGGAGTIGFFLAKHLSQKKQEITIFDNFKHGSLDQDLKTLLKNPLVNLIKGDITRWQDFKKLDHHYDYVYHLAAINGTKNFYTIPHEVLRVGIQGTLNILEWFKNQKDSKILFTSSNEAYASWINLNHGPIPTPENVPLCIDDVTNPRWSYGGSKITGELLFLNYSRIYKFPMTIVRYHNSYGPRMGFEHVIPEFFARILKKENPFNIYGGKETRSFCYIDDTVRATEMVMRSSKTNGEIIHIGNNKEEISMLDLARKMFDFFNYHPKVKINPAPEGCVKRRCSDLKKIKCLTGYQATVDLETGLKKTWEWYQNKF